MFKLTVFVLVVPLIIMQSVAAAPVPELFWSYNTGGTVTGVAVSDGGNYTAAASSDGYLYFLNNSKKLMWKVQTEDVPLKVAVSRDGSMIFAGSMSSVHLYNKTGAEQWSYLIGDEIVDLAVTPSGDRIAVGSLNHYVYMLNDVGGILWKYKTNAPVFSVAISSDGKYVAAGTSGSITYLLTEDGNLLWEYISRGSIDGVGILGTQVLSGERYPTFLEDGNRVGANSNTVCDITGIKTASNGKFALVGCGDGEIYLLDKTKKRLWSYDVGKTSLDSSISQKGDYAVVAGGNTVYILESPDIVPPTVKITGPVEGESVSGIVEIDADVLEDSKYTLRVFIDGDFACSKLPCNWNTGASAAGEHEITIEVNDSWGNVNTESVNIILGQTLLDDIAGEISEKQEAVEEKQEVIKETEEAIKETEEAIKEHLDGTLPESLPPIRSDRDYSPIVKGILIIVSVYIVLKVLGSVIPGRKKGRGGKYKFRH
jgi:outer membrane protein assembly factor BamB